MALYLCLNEDGTGIVSAQNPIQTKSCYYNNIKQRVNKMNEIKAKYLPVGTVVLLANGSKRVMINGFCTMDANKPDKIYDYSGVLFPEGSLSSDQTLLFDHSQIVRVDHYGLEDQEEKDFKVKLVQIAKAAEESAASQRAAQ